MQEPQDVERRQRIVLSALADHTTVEVVEALARRDVHSVLLKGPAIATFLYDLPVERTHGDVDLLVPPHRLDTARRVLEELGFSNKLILTSVHERTFHDEPWMRGLVVVELHRTLSGAEAPPAAVWRTLSRRTERIVVEGTPVTSLAPPGLCLLVALHAAHHGAEGGRPLQDLARAVQRAAEPVWQEAVALASELEATGALAAGLRLLPEGSALAERLALRPSTSVGVALHAASAPQMAHALEWLASGPLSSRQKVAFVARKVVPPAAFLRAIYPVANRGRLGLATAYVVRIGTLVRRLPAGVRALRVARRTARST